MSTQPLDSPQARPLPARQDRTVALERFNDSRALSLGVEL